MPSTRRGLLAKFSIVSIGGEFFKNPAIMIKAQIKTNAKLNRLDNNLFAIEGELDILLSEFKVERPSLLFVEIEDLVKIKYSIQGVKNE